MRCGGIGGRERPAAFSSSSSVLKDGCYVGTGTSFDVIARPVEAFSVKLKGWSYVLKRNTKLEMKKAIVSEIT
jgi:hypothetical protein